MEKRFQTPHTQKTPFTDFNADTGDFAIRGKSVPDNAAIFYEPLFEWLDQYSQSPAKNTIVTVQFEYFNTSTAKFLLDMFSRLELLQASKKSEVVVNWQYSDEDEDIKETGEDYQSICKIPFNITPITK